MAHFFQRHKTDDASHVTKLYFKEIILLHGVSKTIVSNCDSNFLSYFWKTLWRMLNTRLPFSTTCHPQINGQMEVTNRTLTVLLHGMVSKSLKDWDLKLTHVEFACNRSMSYTTGHSPFEVVYGINLLTPIDLIPTLSNSQVNFDGKERAQVMKKLHEQIRTKIEKANESYKKKANWHRKKSYFERGDLVWLHLRKERFPSHRRNKLMLRVDGHSKFSKGSTIMLTGLNSLENLEFQQHSTWETFLLI